MTNWQFIAIIGTFVLSVFGFILTIHNAARSWQASLSEQFTSFRGEMRAELASTRSELKGEIETLRRELKGEIEALRIEIRQNDKRYDERFARVEADIREIKNDFRQAFKPVLPGA
jgi:hypothetical protein